MGEYFDLFHYLGDKGGGEQEKEDGKKDREKVPDSSPLAEAARVATLEQWREYCLQCQRCPLREGACGVVFGEGSPQAEIVFVGEGPGAEEDRLGRPFVGPAGQLLDRIINAAGLKREDVYIANIVKCRPRGNRAPLKEEMEACYPLLEKQLELIDPPIVVCLGAVAARVLVSPGISITRERGQWHRWGRRMVMPTFHPAALLRDPRKKRPVWEDMQQVMSLYRELQRKGS